MPDHSRTIAADPTQGSSGLSYLLARNRAWVARRAEGSNAGAAPAPDECPPEIFWIGCSDSRVLPNEIVGLEPGEVLVHRNMANLAPINDFNSRSVLQFAVEALGVRHIVVVGHHGCRAMELAGTHGGNGLIDHWLAPVRELYRTHHDELQAIGDDAARHNRLCELNVRWQVQCLTRNPVVTKAWKNGQRLSLHGWVCETGTGMLTDLGISCDGLSPTAL